MARNLPPRMVRAGAYQPTSPRTGNQGDSGSWRMSNLIVRGRNERQMYWENYSGEGTLNEPFNLVALTGTIGITANSVEVTGTGTLFTQECHLGQKVCAIPGDNSASWLLVVRRIIDDENMVVWKAPDTTLTTLTGWRMPRLYAINDQRGVSLTGNVLKLDKGSFLGVGSGTFYLNGQPLPGVSLALTRRPTIALYNPATGNYSVFQLGMTTPAAPALAAVAGGTKDMQAGNYSMVITPARKETLGYNNPSNRADVTIATGDQVRVTFPAMDTGNGQNAWIVWVTTYIDTLGSDLNYLEGPWHRLRLVDDTEVSSAGGILDFEWLDAEVENNEIVSFNNDTPTDAEFVESMNAIPVYISCQGQGNVVNPAATSPGPFISPSKPNNIEAAPLELVFSSSPPETILGSVTAQGRIYLLTINKLQIAQSTPSDTVPIIIRPFWHDGFANPDQLVFVNGTLYGFPVAGPSRSVGDGDQIEAERDWAEDVAEIVLGDGSTGGWNPGQVGTGHDPFDDMVLYIHSADHLNSAGYWTTRILGFGISQNFWVFDGLISSNTQDSIVSGVATVGDRLELLVGGRGAGTPTVNTVRFDDGVGTAWMLAPQITDSGVEQRDKVIKSFRAIGKLTEPKYAVYGYGPTEQIDVAAIENGTGSKTGLKTLTGTASVSQTARQQLNIPNCMAHTVRLSGEWDGEGIKDRIDEILVEVAEQGIRR